jgi:hypothetical protein
LKNTEDSSSYSTEDQTDTEGETSGTIGQTEEQLGTIFCPCESDMSPMLTVTCPASPSSPHVRIEDMNTEGVDVTWEMPQQDGDAAITVSVWSIAFDLFVIKEKCWSSLEPAKFYKYTN